MLGKKIALGFGIAIIFPMMVHYGFATFFTPPKLPKFETLNYGWSIIDQDGKRVMREPTEEEKNEEGRKKEENEKRSLKYQKEMEKYSEKQFYIIVPLGVLAILIGIFVPLQAIGTGLIFGGILSIIEGYLGYWYYLSNDLKFISLVIAFIVLILTGYKKLK